MSRSTPSILLFDVMSTLVYDPIAEEIPAFFGLTLKQLYDRKHPDAWQRFERGEIDHQTFCDIYFPHRTEPIDARALRDVLYDAYRWLPGIEPLLEQLSQRGIEMHALSNYPVWYQIIEEKLELSRYLNWSFVSCNTGVRKPDESAFEHALNQLNAAPQHCLFIDDRPANCRAARRVGIGTILFEDAPQLHDELNRRNIL